MYIEKTDEMRKLFPEPPTLASDKLLLRPLVLSDAADLCRLTLEAEVYRYLPTFLFEKQFADMEEAIRLMYTDGLKDSLILGAFRGGRFCGLAEVYGYKAPIFKVSVGYRLMREEWGKGIATEALRLMLDEVLQRRGIEIVTASTMVENHASARVLQKNGFTLVNTAVDEDWGYPEPTPADKWIR